MYSERPHLEQPESSVGYAQLAAELDGLQSQENDGRGVRCVRSIVESLRRGRLDDAKAEAETDADKIRNYPEIEAAMRRAGLLQGY